MSSGKCFRPPHKGKKKIQQLLVSVCPWLFSDSSCPFFPSSENLLLNYEGNKKQVEKVVIMCILFEFLASFLELVPLSKSCVFFFVTCSWNMRRYNH